MLLSVALLTSNTLPDPTGLHLLGGLFVLVAIALLGGLMNGLRTGRIRHMYKSGSEVREQYFGIPQTDEERLRSQQEGGHLVLPFFSFIAVAGLISLGLMFLGVLPMLP